ncbi:hypothetical protein BYT27DRAFT_7191006 [Phlegmacium glaucopus]|nr:hypothetical protein BYT27DRAFT_7191006 [Phlegmacium glaucopus]
MEKKCNACATKDRECVVDKGKKRCTECEGAKTKCSFILEGQQGRTRATTKAKTPEVPPRPLKRKRGEKTVPPPPTLHLPVIQLTTRSPATLPSVPSYLTKNSRDCHQPSS